MWLDFEPRLIAQLQATLPGTVTVLSARDLVGVKEQLQAAPAVQVYGGDYAPVEDAPTGRVAVVQQSWMCVVVVRNSADQKQGAGARAEAGPICDAVLAALLGWPNTDPADTRLKLAKAPAPMWTPGGFGYYPLAFTRRITVTGAPS